MGTLPIVAPTGGLKDTVEARPGSGAFRFLLCSLISKLLPIPSVDGSFPWSQTFRR